MRKQGLAGAIDPAPNRFPSLGMGARLGPAEPGTPEGPGTGVVTETETEVRTRHVPRYKVFVHNDPVTSMEFVVYVLVNVFSLRHKAAIQVMFEAHQRDLALVGLYSLEQAEFRVEQAHSLARSAKYPLTFSYEPE